MCVLDAIHSGSHVCVLDAVGNPMLTFGLVCIVIFLCHLLPSESPRISYNFEVIKIQNNDDLK